MVEQVLPVGLGAAQVLSAEQAGPGVLEMSGTITLSVLGPLLSRGRSFISQSKRNLVMV